MCNKKVLNIYGSCILRDTFGMHEDDGGYIINKYVRIPNPISLVTNSPLYNVNEEIDDKCFVGVCESLKKYQILELRKHVFDYIGGDSDYLIIDCVEFRRNLLYFPEIDGILSEIDDEKLLNRYIDRKYIPTDYKIINPLEIEKEQLYKYLKEFCDKFLSLYKKEKIILFEIEPVEFHYDGKTIHAFNSKEYELAKEHNERIKVCFDFVKKYMQGCHIVEFPKGVLGDTNHKWGKKPLHYTSEYYDYAKNAVDIITNNFVNNEEKKLQNLKEKYEKLIEDKYRKILRINLEVGERKHREAEKILKYEKFLKKILISDHKEKIKSFLNKNGITDCALYGKTQITDVFVVWFREWNIDIEFIVENWGKSPRYEEIPLIKRNDLRLLNCSNMIICDTNDSAVKKKLIRLGFEGTALSYSELIE